MMTLFSCLHALPNLCKNKILTNNKCFTVLQQRKTSERVLIKIFYRRAYYYIRDILISALYHQSHTLSGV